ncbi:MAG: trypsin-like peptidase domain-containing protein [Lachnospiraceae bacterium]|nr:trypsin-like peptidase domain-containing protein [Lachnospiraceae bacterium]
MYENQYDNQNQNNTNQNKPQEYYYSAGSNNYQYNSGNTPNQKKPKKSGGFAKKAVAAICLGVLFGASTGVAFSIPTYMANQSLQQSRIALEEAQQQAAENAQLQSNTNAVSTTTSSLVTSSNTQAATTDVTAIANSCLPSVVSITNKGVTEVQTMFGTYQQDSESSGSGIIIGSNDKELLIVTNYHVVSSSNELSVVFSYDEDSDEPSLVSAKLKGYDSEKDLAVISVSQEDITDEMRSQIKIATIGDSSTLQLGQEVVAIGNALGYGQSVTTGIISALNREVSVSADDGSTITNKLIQTDAAINPGNSGGALLNMNGELIGINSVKVASSSVEGMGYAIPISDVQSIIEELMLKETRDVVAEEDQGYLGISGPDVTADIASAYNMPIGIFISQVYDGSPAEAAGLKKNDIITKFDGQTVKTMSELKNLLTYYRAGETVEVTAMVQDSQGYTEKTFTLTLGTKDIFGDASSSSSNSTQETPSQQNPYENYGGNGGYSWPYSFWPFEY